MVNGRLQFAVHKQDAHNLQLQSFDSLCRSHGCLRRSSAIVRADGRHSSKNTLHHHHSLLSHLMRLHHTHSVHIQVHQDHEKESRELDHQRSKRDHYSLVRLFAPVAAHILDGHIYATLQAQSALLVHSARIALLVLVLVLLDAARGSSALFDAGSNI